MLRIDILTYLYHEIIAVFVLSIVWQYGELEICSFYSLGTASFDMEIMLLIISIFVANASVNIFFIFQYI